MQKVFLNPKREYPTIRRHPWIFSGAIRNVQGSPEKGESVCVCDSTGRCLGYGSYSPESQIRVRMMSFDSRCPIDEKYVASLVESSVKRRTSYFSDDTTNAFRLAHGESDSLPGVIVDYYDGWVVVQIASALGEYWKDVIVKTLMACVPGIKGVFNRSDVDSRVKEGLSVDSEDVIGVLAGEEPPELIEICERGIRFFVDVRKGHKTGFYLDQRMARKTVASYAKDKEVLNCFSYTGGFGIYCANAGAKSVINLDLSKDALALAQKNFELSSSSCEMDFVCADVFKQLRSYRDACKTFDLIVLDPPKFAESKSQLMRAVRGYKDINVLAMKLLRPGGILATFSCSGAMTEDLFLKMLSDAAFDARCDMRILERTMQAGDHPVPVSFAEGLYLKGFIIQKGDTY